MTRQWARGRMVASRVRLLAVVLAAPLLLMSASTVSAAEIAEMAGAASDAPTVGAPFPSAPRMDEYLDHLAADGRLSGAVLVARGGMRFVRAYGMADRAAGIPNTEATMFRLGSVTKQFTAMVILILEQRRLLDVHDPVCRYVPDCPSAWAPITLEQLLTHTSGIPDYINSTGFVAAWPPKDATPDELLSLFRGLPLEFAPGTRMRYSNSGYTLLGYVIERVSGVAYADFLQRAIFAPLGMDDSGFDTMAIRPGHARGYYPDGTEPEPYALSAFYAAGALYATLGDMERWDEALDGASLVSPELMRAMFTPHAPCPPPGGEGGCLLPTDVGYGYGWFIAHEPQGTLYDHVGHIDGYFSFNGLYPEQGLHVIVLSNTEGTDVLSIGRTLAAMAVTMPG